MSGKDGEGLEIKKKTKTFYTGWIAWKIQAKTEEIEEEKNLQKNVSLLVGH